MIGLIAGLGLIVVGVLNLSDSAVKCGAKVMQQGDICTTTGNGPRIAGSASCRPGRSGCDPDHPSMLFMLWLTVRLLTRLLVLPNGDDGTKDLEILVLRASASGAAPQDRPPQVHRR